MGRRSGRRGGGVRRGAPRRVRSACLDEADLSHQTRPCPIRDLRSLYEPLLKTEETSPFGGVEGLGEYRGGRAGPGCELGRTVRLPERAKKPRGLLRIEGIDRPQLAPLKVNRPPPLAYADAARRRRLEHQQPAQPAVGRS